MARLLVLTCQNTILASKARGTFMNQQQGLTVKKHCFPFTYLPRSLSVAIIIPAAVDFFFLQAGTVGPIKYTLTTYTVHRCGWVWGKRIFCFFCY